MASRVNVVFVAIMAIAIIATALAAPKPVSVSVNEGTGVYTVSVDSKPWYSSPSNVVVCVKGQQVSLGFKSSVSASGSDKFGAWTGTTAMYSAMNPTAAVDLTFKSYTSVPGLLVGTATFGTTINTTGCGTNEQQSTQFPSFDTTVARAPSLDTLSWRGGVIATTAAAKGLGNLGANGLDCGPVVSVDPTSDDATTLVWSTLDSHKIVPQTTIKNVYAMGLAAAIPEIPSGFNYSVVFSANTGGATAAMYAWGTLIQGYHDISYSKRSPSITLTDIGYYTDDGAYYYVWGGGKELHDPELSPWIPPRQWPAEKGLVLVKQALYGMGVPVAYMQLDDWWYQGPFFFGNVKSVVDWHASNSSGLFPHGLPAFSDNLGLPLQLYVPFWNDKFQTKYRTFESTTFKGTKLVVPDDSYHFFSDFFDLGKSMTNGRFSTFEIDFLDDNFRGCADCFLDVGAADRWYKGLADAALERNITLQFCLPSATDMLASLSYPSVVQARASGDYARPEGNMSPWDNVVTLGGASLLLGATAMAPSKDTLWTASPQPPTSSDRTHSGYITQPHVQLDCILATLSLGPVGISDALNHTDAGLIGQSFRNKHDSTLLRPSRPLSTVDSVWTNISNSPPPPPPTPGPTPTPKKCVLGSYVGCYKEPAPSHFYAYNALTKRGLNPNDPHMTRDLCASMCGELAAEEKNAKIVYAAVESSDQCFCGVALPNATGGVKVAESQCDMPCKGDPTHMCGGGWLANVYALQCTTEVAIDGNGDGFQSSTSSLLSSSSPLSSSSSSSSFVDVGVAIKSGSVADVRATHASLGEGNGPNSHYVLTWMTTADVTLQSTDLYPAPASGVKLAVRKHIASPSGVAQLAGCVDGQAAEPACIDVLASGQMPTLPPVATSVNDITKYGYWAVYEPLSNGAYFVGELEKFVHVAPQRFAHVLVQGSGPCGLTIRVKGTSNEAINLVAVDPKGITHVTVATIPSTGFVDVMM